ncbi:MAG TPA: hypothetical protein IAC05_00605 [Candidatus Coprenecus stercorigallinarum]|nr:hypothetical protein [Candidatus Coprenecus stercorigallinarum]
MKLRKLIPVAAMAAFAAAGCNPVEEVRLAAEVAGTYSGWSKAEFQYSPTPMASDAQTITVTEEADATVSVNYTSDTWGTFTLTGVTVTESNGTYTLSGSGTTVMGMSAGSQSEYECTLTATVSGTSDFSFVFEVPAVMGGLTITVSPGEVPYGLLISGTYTGVMNMSVGGHAMDPVNDATVSLDATGEKPVLTISSFGMGSMVIENLTVEVTVTEAEDGSYTLAAGDFSAAAGEINVTGSLAGTVSADGNSLTISAEVKPGAMPMSITLAFEGEK